ncbi:glycosyltransferase family 2 protein [Pontibacter sp. G13]|uniref:glycosyltransferase family 2 protein n=1 Tax=Pontibacter sp. G13 TaxID=3074898 RepID=UPI00288C385E|nr:glycosyltransferase family 2 protein [Pontibacter sp. G13]WNJ15974.1 glycosyltransferase family 2 protein [Pontibacter sp. G13]
MNPDNPLAIETFDLSIIIVNYNVKHFLEQCLLSVKAACEGIQAEVIVVDNNSVDGSQQMLKDKFSEDIILIENTDNPGFSKANNQGIQIAKGRYVLLLNPDTVVEEHTFKKCIDFMDARPKAGALGVKMIDGQGEFLPESKRALPTAAVSFYKIFGLASIFPKSKRFGQYHLTYLDKDENHEIEILSGAYMFMRKTALDEIGYLDETFFMYGEDIDLSYRFILAGYQNYYLADTQIIHYKGESTKKGSLNYVRVFYQAMIIFAEKHFGGRRKRLFITAIHMAVYFRAFIAILRRMVDRLGFPLMEAGLIYGTIFGIKEYWEHYVKFIEGGFYPQEFSLVYMPAYTLVFVAFLWLAGAYKKPFRIRPLISAPFWAFVFIATCTYMFDGILNFSRAIVGLSAVFTMIIAIATRGLINQREKGTFFFMEERVRRAILFGESNGIEHAAKLIQQELDYPVELVGYVSDSDYQSQLGNLLHLGPQEQLREILQFYRVDEIIFPNQDLSTEAILQTMTTIRDLQVAYKIVPQGADYIVGPQAIHTSRFSQGLDFKLKNRQNQIQKRLFDLVSSSVLLLTFPLLFPFYKKPLGVLKKLTQVLFRKKHMVGYIHPDTPDLPTLRQGLLNMMFQSKSGQNTSINTQGLDQLYAQRYRWDLDLEILLRGWRNI